MKKITKILHGTDALYILKLQKLGESKRAVREEVRFSGLKLR